MPNFTVSLPSVAIAATRREFPALLTDAAAAQQIADSAVQRLVQEWQNRHKETDRIAFRAGWQAATPVQRSSIRSTLGLNSGEDP